MIQECYIQVHLLPCSLVPNRPGLVLVHGLESGTPGPEEGREHGQGALLGYSLEPSNLAGPTRVTLGQSLPYGVSVFPSVK